MRTAIISLIAALLGFGGAKLTNHDRELLNTVKHVGVYCNNGHPAPKGWVRIARVLVRAGDGKDGGCTHDLYVKPKDLKLIYWPVGCDSLKVENYSGRE